MNAYILHILNVKKILKKLGTYKYVNGNNGRGE